MNQHLRQDKTCLNCSKIVEERYCTHCGQENIEIKESFGHLFRHFFEDLTHYDSKFFITIKDLLLKPGFLTKEYLAGRRASYLHPIRMYVFISFVYFLALFTFFNPGHGIEEQLIEKGALDNRRETAASLQHMLAAASQDADSGKVRQAMISEISTRLGLDTLPGVDNTTLILGITHKDLLTYDSLQRSLPAGQKDWGLKPWIYGRWLKTLNHDGELAIPKVIDTTSHITPKMMFVLLPLFALLLKLFYSRKKFYYADHAIFSLHLHSAAFLIFLFLGLVEKIFPSWGETLGALELLFILVYLAIALRRAYGKSILFSIFATITLGFIYLALIVVGWITVAVVALL